MRALPLLLCLVVVLAGCRTRGEPSVREPAVPAPPIVAAPPTATRGEFTIEADKLDTWNAIGQIAVRTPGVDYQGRAQMLDLYSLRYRGLDFFVLTKALPAAQTGNRITTKVTATTLAGKPLEDERVAHLLAHFQRELPAEIASVRARQAAERHAKPKAKAKAKKARTSP
ncbi:hypothetical protein QLQ15_12490 [Lysobacter sp. LF1]|uniref:Lipoprotein n=1 Tax=Lysobacter stagni TaxID=3045172 RepID=A0ABT6XHU4_9GAMM|nr:hypothetical protein [Lysobacter sp. LF1]MDI9239722.1 hypothetical protein [Lysobacter sp. LF1]